MPDPRVRSDSVPGPRIVLIPAPAAYAICATFVVVAAAWLGTGWVREPSLGLPIGIWIVVLGAAIVARVGRRREERARRGTGELTSGPRLQWRRWVRETLTFPAFVARRLGATDQRIRVLEDQCSTRVDRALTPVSPLRVGVGLPGELAEALVSTAGDLAVTWVRVERTGDAQGDCRDQGLDAVVRRGEFGPLTVTTPECPGRIAAWHDWALPRPLSYASVFPARVDPGQVTLVDADELGRSDAPMLRALIEAAAGLSRSPARLSLPDRLLGRTPRIARHAHASATGEDALHRLAEPLERGVEVRASLARPAARALAAWLASTPATIDIAARRAGIASSVAILPDEPESLLRLAAVLFASHDDSGAFEALQRADKAIRASRPEPISDQFAFLDSEVRLGVHEPMTLGRVAAGICLIAATRPADHLPHLRDDIMDDLRFSEWLVGRDQDRALLMDAFRMLERARTSKPRRSAAAA